MRILKDKGRIGIVLMLAPLAVLSVCLVITFLVWDAARQNASKELQYRFNAEVKEIHGRIDERLNDYRNILRGAGGLFAASNSVERREFRAYADKLELNLSYPGIQGVGFAQLIPAREKQRMIAAMRRNGYPQFSIRPEGERDPYTAIIYLEPFDWRNQRAFGYDMYSEPVRRAAMEQARDSDGPAITGKVVLVQEIEKEVQHGFLLYQPVYRNNLPHETVADRRSNLAGWVYEPFRMNDLMNKGVLGRYLDTIRDELEIEVYDGDKPSKESLMYDSQALFPPSDPARHAQFYSIQTSQHFGHDWTIIVRSLPAFEARERSQQVWAVAVGGGIISLLLTLVVWLLATTNARAMKLAKRMSEKREQVLTQTIAAMATVTEMRDPYTAGHQRSAAELARAIAVEMGLDDEQILVLYRSALIYEVGKIRIPAEILSKPYKLDEVEYALAQTHAQAGFDILRGIDFPWPIAQIVLQHHERMDGSGYPHGLHGDEILLEARIIAVADVVDAMCSHRPYRAALGVEAALEEISSKRGILYDPAVVDACTRLLRKHGNQFPSSKTNQPMARRASDVFAASDDVSTSDVTSTQDVTPNR
jgi:HD-GYP domain-containing protein (c-di-GMP phosphodiesterase class II)